MINRKSPTESSVTVCVRVRPRNEQELNNDEPICFLPNSDETGIDELDSEHGGFIKTWRYDHCFAADKSNAYIFQTVGTQLIDSALDGYSTVMFLYGQTSSGNII